MAHDKKVSTGSIDPNQEREERFARIADGARRRLILIHVLWVAQSLLALLFLCAGVKLVLPLGAFSRLPLLFPPFIGIADVLGLILPGGVPPALIPAFVPIVLGLLLCEALYLREDRGSANTSGYSSASY